MRIGPGTSLAVREVRGIVSSTRRRSFPGLSLVVWAQTGAQYVGRLTVEEKDHIHAIKLRKFHELERHLVRIPSLVGRVRTLKVRAVCPKCLFLLRQVFPNHCVENHTTHTQHRWFQDFTDRFREMINLCLRSFSGVFPGL